MSDYKTIDLGYLEDLSGGDDAIIVEMIELFLENAPVAIDNIKRHNQAKDWEKLAKEAHKFKPNLAYMGVEDARTLLEEIEKSAKKQDNLDELSDKISEVEAICKRAYAELNSVLRDLK